MPLNICQIKLILLFAPQEDKNMEYKCVEMLYSLDQRCLTVVGFWVDRFQTQVFSEQSHRGVFSVW